ncbi:MAG: rhodanese [Desulfobulbaceae bacterium]|nr:rhodanese [Desulfobulbaceae bacterium]
MSTQSAGLAVKNGYTNVKVMLKGVPGWKKTGHAVVASENFIKTGNHVLVDLRSSEEYKKGHIPRAYNIPMADLEDAEDDFPSNMSAPVVLYGKEVKQAYKLVKSWGYKTTSYVDGGIDGWVAAGNSLDTSPSPDEIVWVRVLEKGEVSLADFNRVVEENPAGSVILDVRTNDEAAEGKFEHALHIALDELTAKIESLPKDKEILVHCTTGARAEMAYQELIKAGFNARYLVANVECDEDGCEAEE